MVKVHTKILKERNIKVLGKMIIRMVLEKKPIKMVHFLKVTFRIILKMVKVSISGVMAPSIQENGNKIK
jgi:hypothetical protein